jgi:hypothetical protein
MRQLAEIVPETVPGCRVELAPGASPDTRPWALSSWRLPTCPLAAHGQSVAALPFRPYRTNAITATTRHAQN